MLKETLQQSKKFHKNPKIFQFQVCFEGQFSIICKRCGFFLAPLAASSHYLNIDIESYRFGNHFLVMDEYEFPELEIGHENEIFNTQQPFYLMFLKPVYCDYCHQVVGLYFETANVLGNQWLLDRIMLNMQRLQLDKKGSFLMQSTTNQLFSLLNEVEIAKQENKVHYRKQIQQERWRNQKEKNIKSQRDLEKILLENTNKTFPQNERKGELVRQILSQLSFFDRRTQRLQKECKQLLEGSYDLKEKIINRYAEIQKSKIEMIRKKKEAQKMHYTT